MTRLNLSTVDGVRASARTPSYDPRSTGVGVVHIGLGGFHRAHQAAYLDDVLADDPSWGICAVAPRNPAVADTLREQDGLYTVLTRGDTDALRVIGSIRETRCLAQDPGGVLHRLADPAVRLVTLTVTEKAYRADLSTRRLRVDDDLRADAGGADPRTVVGLLVRGLALRAKEDAPVTVLSCDNLSGNGALLATLVHDYCTLLPDGDRLADWINGNVRFPSSMVDRIVPAVTDDQRNDVSRRLGCTDGAAVVTEPFGQWVIEDAFAAGQPPWSSPDIRVVADVEPYERLKLRVVNAAHSTLAYLGLLAGHEDVAGAAADPALAGVLEHLLDTDILPTLADLPDAAVAAYRDSVLPRFANPAIHYPLRQVGADGSLKLPQRLIPVALQHHRAGGRAYWVAMAIAGWMRWVHKCATGEGTGFVDPLADELLAAAAATATPAALADALLAQRRVFDAEIAENSTFRADVVDWLQALWSAGPADAVRAVTHG